MRSVMGQGSSIVDTLGSPTPCTQQDCIVGKVALLIVQDLEITKRHVTSWAFLPALQRSPYSRGSSFSHEVVWYDN